MTPRDARARPARDGRRAVRVDVLGEAGHDARHVLHAVPARTPARRGARRRRGGPVSDARRRSGRPARGAVAPREADRRRRAPGDQPRTARAAPRPRRRRAPGSWPRTDRSTAAITCEPVADDPRRREPCAGEHVARRRPARGTGGGSPRRAPTTRSAASMPTWQRHTTAGAGRSGGVERARPAAGRGRGRRRRAARRPRGSAALRLQRRLVDAALGVAERAAVARASP